jgi:ElaB/YqjD/DUF883 family membrane-anchored ribosome-binding protein
VALAQCFCRSTGETPVPPTDFFEENKMAKKKKQSARKETQELCQKVRQEATDKLRQMRETTVGDLLDRSLNVVKKHPGAGVLLAAAVGFFFGRLFKR